MPYSNYDLQSTIIPDIDEIKGYIRKANHPTKRDVRPLMSVLQRLEEADSYLFGLTHKRKAGPKSLKWDIRLPLEFKITPTEEQQLQETKTRFRRAQMMDTLEDIVDGVLYGMSAVRLIFDNTKWGTMVTSKETYDLTDLDFSDETNGLVEIITHPNGAISKKELDPEINLIVRHNPKKNMKNFIGSYMRSAMLLTFLKYHAKWDWRDLLKRHGVPGTYITYPRGIDEKKEIPKLIKMAEKFKNDAVAVFPDYVKVIYEQALKSDSTDSFNKFISAVNTELAILFHGQNLTTEVSGGSFAATQVHNEIDDLIIVGEDVEKISKIMTNQYLKQDYINNYGEPRNDFFEFFVIDEEQEDFESNSRIISNLWADPEFKQQFKIKKHELYTKLGFTVPTEDDETV